LRRRFYGPRCKGRARVSTASFLLSMLISSLGAWALRGLCVNRRPPLSREDTRVLCDCQVWSGVGPTRGRASLTPNRRDRARIADAAALGTAFEGRRPHEHAFPSNDYGCAAACRVARSVAQVHRILQGSLDTRTLRPPPFASSPRRPGAPVACSRPSGAGRWRGRRGRGARAWAAGGGGGGALGGRSGGRAKEADGAGRQVSCHQTRGWRLLPPHTFAFPLPRVTITRPHPRGARPTSRPPRRRPKARSFALSRAIRAR
jgi:hypothetical protein